MIFKKIKNPKHSTTKRTRIIKLTNYICLPRDENGLEKCVYVGSRGFLTDDLKSRQGEMIGLANENVKSKDPIEHYMLSWQSGEQPNEKQIEEAVDIFVKEMELKNHQIIFALHDNTKNIHLHLVANRINPVTGKATRINDGWDLEAGHKAIAIITKKQGWNQEENDLYQVLDNENVCRREKKEREKISDKAKIVEIKSGEISAERIAKEEAWSIIENAKSWQEIHFELEKKGIRFEKKGSGAIIIVNDIAIKASTVNRAASLGKLQKRLGPYEKKGEGVEYYEHRIEKPYFSQFGGISKNNMCKLSECCLAYNRERQIKNILSFDACAYRRRNESLRRSNRERERQEIDSKGTRAIEGNRNKSVGNRKLGGNVEFEEYLEIRRKYNQDKKINYHELKKRHQEERNFLFQKQKKERENATAGNWKRRGKKLNEIRSLLAARHTKQKLVLKEKQEVERNVFRKKYPPMIDFDKWKVKSKHNKEIKNSVLGDNFVVPVKVDFRFFDCKVVAGNIYYFNAQSTEKNVPTAFIDKGKIIDVLDAKKTSSVLAALQLAAQKWGVLHIEGSDEYKNLCLQLAAENGIKISNPELQAELIKKQEAIKKEKRELMKTKQEKLFEIYNRAVGAERYRVTSIRMFKNGNKKAFILDRQNGVTKGFTPEEISTKMQEIIRLQNRGENIYFTPLSENKHHILIDDMTKEKLKQFLADGYKPAVLIESSPENFQCVITIPKLGSEFDREIGNRLTERLNKEYGDKNLSGCIHPHRAPGFENRKKKHQNLETGDFPEVKLLKAGKRECEKCIERAKLIEKEYQELARQRAERQKEQFSSVSYPGSPETAYEAHLANIKQHITIEDRSRVDAMIAVRLRATGHSQESVMEAIKSCAPMLRQDENRNWERYAQRTVEYAFGLKGDQQLQQYEHYIAYWKKIENQIETQAQSSDMRL